MKQITALGVIRYTVATTSEMVLAAKHLHHDVYVQMGYISQPYADRVIPLERENSSRYIVALNDTHEVVGTIRLNVGSPFTTLKVWERNLYPCCEQLIKDVLAGNSFEIGAFAVKKEYSVCKISWGLYKAIYQEALALDLSYGVISMDHRALRSMEMLGWFVIRVGQPMNYYGSLTVPGIMPVKMQSEYVSLKNKIYEQYLCA